MVELIVDKLCFVHLLTQQPLFDSLKFISYTSWFKRRYLLHIQDNNCSTTCVHAVEQFNTVTAPAEAFLALALYSRPKSEGSRSAITVSRVCALEAAVLHHCPLDCCSHAQCQLTGKAGNHAASKYCVQLFFFMRGIKKILD
jgi:hypothetical protein